MSIVDVSVIMAVKNEQEFVEDAILSILNQKGVQAEIVVVDDNSNDDTLAILSRLARSHQSLRVFSSPKRGVCAAFNYGVALAGGQFVCLFAGDDIMPPDSLRARWAAVKNYPSSKPVVGLCKLMIISDIKRYHGRLVPRRRGQGSLSGQSYLMNQAARDAIFPIPEELANEDTWMELAVTFFSGWQVVHSDIVGCKWRLHDRNSINIFLDFEEFNTRYTRLMRALPVFYHRHGAELTDESRSRLHGAIQCEKQRAEGNIMGVLLSPVGVVSKLRALAKSNKSLYRMRRRFFGLFSGW
jgi:glycosyltransferase involved in cell wall biosynthesis